MPEFTPKIAQYNERTEMFRGLFVGKLQERAMFKSILVLESPWNSHSVKSKSVWPFVSEFARATDLDAYHQTFFDKASFCHWIAQFHREKTPAPKLLYLAAHGTDGRISGLRKDINGKTIVDALKKAKSIKYVHFGSCLFGNSHNLDALLRQAKHISWAAGYNTMVDWVDSTLFDVMLWGRIASRNSETKGFKTHTLATRFMEEIPGLAKNLGFQFHYRYGASVSGIFGDDN